MNRADFMKRLAELLADVSPAERDEALQYYNDYFDDAGVENEQSVIASLGTPEQLAGSIRTGLADGGSIGEFTEKGFSGYEQNRNDEVLDLNRTSGDNNGNNEERSGWEQNRNNDWQSDRRQNGSNDWRSDKRQNSNTVEQPKKKPLSGGMIVLICFLCIFASPFLLGLGGGIFGIIVGIFAGLFGIVVGIGASAIVLIVVGICLFVYGIAIMFGTPLGGLCLMGVGMICISLGLLFLWITVVICGALIPAIIRGIVSLFQNIFHRGGATA